MNELFLASRNSGKVMEVKAFIKGIDTNIKLRSLLDTPEIPDIEETGKTFEENAVLKAKSIYDILHIPVIADDSGLAVDHLQGKPGVYSARYSGKNASDEDNCRKLLEELKDVKAGNRSAEFICVIVLYKDNKAEVFQGECPGRIGFAACGNGGFGYDPLFIPDGYAETFAELPLAVKNKISHRGKALEKLRIALE